MIRLLREVDYNKYDKTFYFNDAVSNVCVQKQSHIIYYISI